METIKTMACGEVCCECCTKGKCVYMTDNKEEREATKMEVVSFFITEEETQAVKELVAKMRVEREKEEARLAYLNKIQKVIHQAVDNIGLEDTKRIVRDIVRNLK